MKLSLMVYFKYLASSEHARCVSEGEAVLNAGHVILCGKTKVDDQKMEIFALCLQTSALSSDPHKINGVFDVTAEDEDNVQINNFHCSCKAGNSGKCKHISAVLIWCTRQNLAELEHISQTDIKCIWAVQKHSTRESYKAVPIRNMPCFTGKFVDVPNFVPNTEVINKYLETLPNSAISLHRAGRRDTTASSIIEQPHRFANRSALLDNACQSVLMMELSTIPISFTNDCCKIMYAEQFANCDVDSIISIDQTSNSWLKERKTRVTGSRIYSLYTYSSSNWEKKAVTYFWPKSFTNKYIRHGIKFEAEARNVFIERSHAIVHEYGLVISYLNPWLAFSPDGVIFAEDGPAALLEIKCAFVGASKCIEEAAPLLPYLYKNAGDQWCLKKRHKYYGQVQLGMSVLNLQMCHFVVYASYDKSYLDIIVNFDYDFCKDMLFTTKHNFFSNMWHYLCLKN